MEAGTIIAIVQFVLVGIFMVAGGIGAIATDKDGKYIWQISKVVVLYLPVSLGMFTVFAAMFFENANLMVGLLVGIFAVALNFILDGFFFKGGYSAVSSALSGMRNQFAPKSLV
uniref:Uncharacterized protein n=1 Tax=viral metagenome TaxID=1070528 RepID=A0A6C0AI40_9ZZZZ